MVTLEEIMINTEVMKTCLNICDIVNYSNYLRGDEAEEDFIRPLKGGRFLELRFIAALYHFPIKERIKENNLQTRIQRIVTEKFKELLKIFPIQDEDGCILLLTVATIAHYTMRVGRFSFGLCLLS